MARIEHYEFGRIVVDGGEERRDLIILPDRVVRNWWRQDGHALVLEDLDQVLDDLPEHLVIGTGAYGQLRPPSARAPARRSGAPPGRSVGSPPSGHAPPAAGACAGRAALHLTC